MCRATVLNLTFDKNGRESVNKICKFAEWKRVSEPVETYNQIGLGLTNYVDTENYHQF